MKKVVIVDYNCGNIGSIVNMLDYIGVKSFVTNDPDDILSASHVILPGVGSFDHGMSELKRLNLYSTIRKYALQLKRPILGICLGAQLMTKSSEEGCLEGLGLFEATTIKFEMSQSFKIPHMGWNKVSFLKKSILGNPLVEDEWRFYFVHKYYMNSLNREDVLCEADYGIRFHAGLARDNMIALQFHPEKSHTFGMKILNYFLKG